MNRTVSRADARRQYTYSDRCRDCRHNIGQPHATDCPRAQPPPKPDTPTATSEETS